MKIRTVQAEAVSLLPQTGAPKTNQPASAAAAGDTFQAAQKEKLVNMLQQQPEVRPEAVERAKALATDPNYPGSDTIASLAKLFIANAGEE